MIHVNCSWAYLSIILIKIVLTEPRNVLAFLLSYISKRWNIKNIEQLDNKMSKPQLLWSFVLKSKNEFKIGNNCWIRKGNYRI